MSLGDISQTNWTNSLETSKTLLLLQKRASTPYKTIVGKTYDEEI